MRLRRFTWIERFVCFAILAVLTYAINPALAQEFTRTIATATNISLPIVNSTNNVTYATGANNTAFYISKQTGEGAFGAWAAAGTNISIIGTSGIYNFPLNATEMNNSRVAIFYNGTGCLQQFSVINTVVQAAINVIDGIVDDILTDTGTTIPGTITTAQADLDNPTQYMADVSGLPTTAEFEARTMPTADYFVFGSDQVIVATNNDKTGYTAAISFGGITAGAFVAGAITNDAVANDVQVDVVTIETVDATDALAASFGGGTVDANLVEINGTAIPGTGAYVATGLEYFFNVATPAKTMNDVGVAGSGITSQEVRDAMKLAPSGGAASAGSIDAQLATAQADLDSPNQYKADVSGVATTAALAAVSAKIDTVQADLDSPAQYKADVSGLPTTVQLEARTLPTASYFDASTDTVTLSGAAGDPWSVEIPGSYTGSEAGYYLPDLIKKTRGR